MGKQKRHAELRSKIAAHERANADYIEKVARILEPSEQAYSLYVRQNPFEKRRLLEIVGSNYVHDSVSVTGTYNKPFDILAKMPKFEAGVPDDDVIRTLLADVVKDFAQALLAA